MDTVAEATTTRPTVAGFNHVSMPVRDIAEAIRFWTGIFGGKVVLQVPGDAFAEVEVGGMILGLSKQSGGWTGSTAEFPHYAFTVDGAQMRPLQARLSQFGVPTHPIWTRHQVEALMYFRDPSGNLFELYCPQGFPDAKSIPVGGLGRDGFKPDLAALNYDRWNDPKA